MNKIIIFYTILFFAVKYIYENLKLDSIENVHTKLNNHLLTSLKPNIWIHVPTDKNGRRWDSFNSRTSKRVNMPFINLCIESVKEKCGNHFNINIIEDKHFSEYIPDWRYNIEQAPQLEKEKLRKLGLLKIIYYYGGIVVPYSFYCEQNLITLYNNKPFSFEITNKSTNNDKQLFLPTVEFMGSEKNNNFIYKLIDEFTYVENDVTNRLGNILKDNVYVLDGRLIGVKTDDKKTIFLDDYFNGRPKLLKERYGILIPAKELISRNNYSWFCRMSKSQLKNSNVFLAKVIS